MSRRNDQIAEADLPGYYREEAARLRSEADTVETVEMRITLLDWAQWTEQLATELERIGDRRPRPGHSGSKPTGLGLGDAGIGVEVDLPRPGR